jgi:glyoxylase-like metal-dependent hydrolase (beta-lactamase superfamily II)
MEQSLHLEVHGRGNAWPVPLGGEHPFYDRTNPRDLSNAAFSLILSEDGQARSEVLVDAGHGTIQSLIMGRNRIPDCICLTHGHMDHTVSVDWVVQSHWRKHRYERSYPVYCTLPVFQFLIRSYPHLEPLVMHIELKPGESLEMQHAPGFRITGYPVYHGQSAVGASMVLFETVRNRVLFTGDLLAPMLRTVDVEYLKGLDLLVVDTNNRFPWPRTNHWSFGGDPLHPVERGEILEKYLRQLTWEEITAPHRMGASEGSLGTYFRDLKGEWYTRPQPFTILEFLQSLEPRQVIPVHYSGAEDLHHHQEPILSSRDLEKWMLMVARSEGIRSGFTLPEPGHMIPVG